MPLAWYVAETRPRAESLAEQNLARQGYPSFCPRFRKLRRHARRTEQVLCPLFPGYIFIYLDRRGEAWRPINGTRGIRSLVCTAGSSPQPVAHDIMAALKSRCENGLLLPNLSDIKPGQEMQLTSGPFADRIATISSLDDKGRVNILLDILGQQAQISVPAEHLGPT